MLEGPVKAWTAKRRSSLSPKFSKSNSRDGSRNFLLSFHRLGRVGSSCKNFAQSWIIPYWRLYTHARKQESEVEKTQNMTSQSQSQCRFWEDSTLVSKFVHLTMNGVKNTQKPLFRNSENLYGFHRCSILLSDPLERLLINANQEGCFNQLQEPLEYPCTCAVIGFSDFGIFQAHCQSGSCYES
jgi:hypothetical protein